MTRRNRKSRPFHALITEELDEKMLVRSGGRTKRATKLEVMVTQQVLQAVRGEKSGLAFLIKHLHDCADVEQPECGLEIVDTDGKLTREFDGGRFYEFTYPDGRIEWVEKGRGDAQWPIPTPRRIKGRYIFPPRKPTKS